MSEVLAICKNMHSQITLGSAFHSHSFFLLQKAKVSLPLSFSQKCGDEDLDSFLHDDDSNQRVKQ